MNVVDVSSATYAEIRDKLRSQGHAGDVGNKMIHLNEIVLREEEGVCEQRGAVIFLSIFAIFVAGLIWVATKIWR